MNELKEDATFTGMEQCSAATGISMDMLRRCKAHPDAVDGSNGFHQSGRISWAKLKPWYEEHAPELMAGDANDYFRWRAIKMEAEAKSAQLSYEKERQRLIERDKVHAMLRRIANAQSSLMNSRFRQEMVSKMDGLNEAQRQILMDGAIQDFISILQREIDKWK